MMDRDDLIPRILELNKQIGYLNDIMQTTGESDNWYRRRVWNQLQWLRNEVQVLLDEIQPFITGRLS